MTRKRLPNPSLGYSIFPRTRNVTFLYKDTASWSSAGLVNYTASRFKINSVHDFDVDNRFQDKQPLYFDKLLTQDGPYRQYKVNAWKTTLRILNLDANRPIMAYWENGTVNTVADNDSWTEMKNRPGVQSRMLTQATGARSYATIKSFQTLKQCVGANAADVNYAGTYAGSPTIPIYANLLLATIDGSVNAFTVQVEIATVFYCTLFDNQSVIN